MVGKVLEMFGEGHSPAKSGKVAWIWLFRPIYRNRL